MAILNEGFNFTGRVGNLIAYKRKDDDKIIIRMKSAGVSKEEIRNSPAFQRTRENNAEFGACGSASKAIRRALYPVKHLADYNFTPILSKLAKGIQVLDTVGERGKRSILLSRHGHLLEGFQLNRLRPFDSIIRRPVTCSIERTTGTAIIRLPELLSGVNFMTSPKYALFRFIITMGLVPDIVHKNNSYKSGEQIPSPETVFTEWHRVKQSFEARSIPLQLKEPGALTDTKMILVAIGIEMGIPVTNQIVERIEYAGGAKILAIG